jgi:hypothetical protein
LRGSKVAQRTTPYIFLRILKLDKMGILIEKQIKGLLYTDASQPVPLCPHSNWREALLPCLKKNILKT